MSSHARFPDLVEQALSLITLAQIEAPEKAVEIRKSLDQWRLQSPEHDSAYLEAMRQSSVLDAVAPALRDRFDRPQRGRSRAGRNRLLSFLVAAVAVAAITGGFIEWRNRQPVFQEHIATGPGQVASLPLPDGGRIDAGARTVVDVTYFRDRRSVELVRGEARFEVSADSARPFSVQTREGRIDVIGTIFTVSDRGSAVSVAVEHGKVRFSPVGSTATAVALAPGQKLVMHHGVMDPVRNVSPENMAAWRRGWLVFEDEPLSEALPQINAYRKVPIVADDPEVLGLRLTGSFRVAESDNLLLVLPQILPVDSLAGPDGSMRLTLRR